jgi:CheY-like chemotaxis protein
MNRRHPRKVPSRPLVLIVDNADTREFYVHSLSPLGFDVIAAGDCTEAGRVAWVTHPDIVVTELSLPGGDGWQLIQDLRREARTRDIPIVLLSGQATPALTERPEHEGCAASLLKPCLPEALATELRRVLDSTRDDEALQRPSDGDARPSP